jgi:thioredoxin-related protein
MTVTIVIMAVVAAVAAAAAWWQSRARRPVPTATRGEPPAQLDRNDFRAPEAPWLIAVFTSETCSSCAAVWNDVAGHESQDVVTENVEVQRSPELHRRYHIESVPTAVVVDRDGLTRAAFVGPLGQGDREILRTIVATHD